MTWRYIAQRALTGEFLDFELPVSRDELRWDLSGSGSLRGTITPDVGMLRGDDGRLVLEEWGTYLYAEAAGQIRWGGILVASGFDGPDWRIEAAGMSAYPHDTPYTGVWRPGVVDPLDAVRQIWAHLQSYRDGDLGMVVDSTTSRVRVGTADEPYELVWWETRDCGQEIDSLAEETPFDFVEEHAWDGETIAHRLRLGHPRLGRRRHDLAFRETENVVGQPVSPTREGDHANEILAIGAGEGRKVVAARLAERDGRLRRVAVYSDKAVTSTTRMRALARRELQARRPGLDIAEVEVVDHPNARIGSWALGDDVLIEADIPWLGPVAVWSRIVSWSLVDDTRARLHLVRSDRFTYSGGSQ